MNWAKRLKEIKSSENLTEKTRKQMEETIEKGEQMSRENHQLLIDLLS